MSERSIPALRQSPQLSDDETGYAQLIPYFRNFEAGCELWQEQPEPKPSWLAEEIAQSLVQLYRTILSSPHFSNPQHEADWISNTIRVALECIPDVWPYIARAFTQSNLHVWRQTLEGYMNRAHNPLRPVIQAPYAQQMPYREYLKTPHWEAIRTRKLHSTEYRCQVCNSQGIMHVHHRTYIRRGHERLEDLTVLCNSCHKLFHDHGRLAIPPENE